MIRRRPLLRLPVLGLPVVGLPGLGLAPLAGCAADQPQRAALDHGTDEGGIGGTGILGVVGPGRDLVVAGIALAIDPATRFAIGNQPLPPPGTMVAAHAVPRDGRLVATRIALFQPLVGPATHGADGSLAVLGTRVITGPDTQWLGTRRMGAGQRVAVSGFWAGAAVRATAIDSDAAGDAVLLQGQMRSAAGQLLVGGTPLPAERLPAPPPLGRFVVVRGRTVAGALVVDAVDLATPPPLDPPVVRLAVEAVVARDAEGPGLHLAGFGLPVAAETLAALPVGPRLLLLGRHDGRFRVADAVALPDAPEPRARRLADPATLAAIRRWQGA